MTDNELQNRLKEKIKQGNCFHKQVQAILCDYRDSGGKQETAIKLIEQLAIDFSGDEILHANAYDILDIATGWCRADMRVWDKQ